jgi:acetyltransferase
MLVGDAWQGRGLGSELMRRLIDVARREGLARVHGEILATYGPMIRLSRRLGFAVEPGDPTDGTVTARLSLRG